LSRLKCKRIRQDYQSNHGCSDNQLPAHLWGGLPLGASLEALGGFLYLRKECGEIMEIKLKTCLTSVEAILPVDVCNTLIAQFQGKVAQATVLDGDNPTLNKETRSAKSLSIPLEYSPELYAGIAQYCQRVNNENWQFKLEDMDHLQFLCYEIGDKYNYHLDLGPGKNMLRKLSIVIPLSPIGAYEGGELLVKIGEKEKSVPLKQGHAILFPSYILHKVTPVTKGQRFMLVGWMKGKTPFR